MKDCISVKHPFEPLFDNDSRILILGSFPSVKSREQKFFYGHPCNRFWKMLAFCFKEDIPKTIEEKKDLLLRHCIALYDVIESCEISGSSDSSIRNVVPTDLKAIISSSKITVVICNGKAALKYYEKFQAKTLGLEAIYLPSTSPANAAIKQEKLMEEWSAVLNNALNL